MSGKNREKGLQFERRCVAAFRRFFPHAQRHDESAPGAILGYDLENTGPFIIQCKRKQEYAPITAIHELPASSKVPLLITEPDDGPAMAVLPFSALLRLMESGLEGLSDEF